MKKLITLSIIFSFPVFLFSQIKLTENTLRLDTVQSRIEYTIDEMSWYADRWEGVGFGAKVEENFGPPMGETMIGTFRMIKDGKPVFYEMLLIEPDGNSLAYKVKHFNADFSGWEEKEDFVSFPLIKIEKNRYYFDGLTMVHEGDVLTHYLAMKEKDGTFNEVTLNYRRADK
ncbi:MAG: DUF6265 family protein [Bacteroidota bacterium]